MLLRENILTWARRVKRDVIALWFVNKHPRTPVLAKLICIFVVGYALSPIDLIPDFIPVLGYVDDVLLLPALILLAIKLVPADVLEECRLQGDAWMAREGKKPRNYWAATLIVVIWIAGGWAIWHYWFWPYITVQ